MDTLCVYRYIDTGLATVEHGTTITFPDNKTRSKRLNSTYRHCMTADSLHVISFPQDSMHVLPIVTSSQKHYAMNESTQLDLDLMLAELFGQPKKLSS